MIKLLFYCISLLGAAELSSKICRFLRYLFVTMVIYTIPKIARTVPTTNIIIKKVPPSCSFEEAPMIFYRVVPMNIFNMTIGIIPRPPKTKSLTLIPVIPIR